MRAALSGSGTRRAREQSPRRIVILGAARSGTKMLRDALARATGAGSVPYDIGYVWRVGNEGNPDDLLSPGAIGPEGQRFIRRFVDRYADGVPPAVIEKTVGNTMRVPSVASVLPDAMYIHLIRDGVDVIESTRRQWTAPADLRYLLGKARHFPPRLAPRYGVKYLRSIAGRHRRDDGRIGTWGPRYPGIDEDLKVGPLLAVCARQWRWAVVQARTDLARLKLPVVEVRYEQFVTEPEAELERLTRFAGLPSDPLRLRSAAGQVVATRLGVGRGALTHDELDVVDTEAGELLSALSYGRAPIQKDRNDVRGDHR